MRRETGEQDTGCARCSSRKPAAPNSAAPGHTLRDAFETMFRGIDDAEYAALVATLNKMLNNVRQHEI